VQRIEKALAAPDAPAQARYAALVRQGRLLRLAGDLAGAARSWAGAAAAAERNSGNKEAALLEGAFCLVALGELDSAEQAVKSVLEAGKDQELIQRAIYLFAYIHIFRSGADAPLSALITNSGYARHRPAIYYVLWRYSGESRYKDRLLADYPESPEAFIARDLREAAVAPTPMWLLFPGPSGIAFGAAAAEESAGEFSLHLPAPPAFADAAPAAGQRPLALQTGVFSREANAAAQADRLRDAGFESAVSRRAAADGSVFWAVTVPPGPDAERTISRLREKGFDSLRLFHPLRQP
jgi:tetratricopeptide (TPR) repeat protein